MSVFPPRHLKWLHKAGLFVGYSLFFLHSEHCTSSSASPCLFLSIPPLHILHTSPGSFFCSEVKNEFNDGHRRQFWICSSITTFRCVKGIFVMPTALFTRTIKVTHFDSGTFNLRPFTHNTTVIVSVKSITLCRRISVL